MECNSSVQPVDLSSHNDLTQSDARLLQEAIVLGIPLALCNNRDRRGFVALHSSVTLNDCSFDFE